MEACYSEQRERPDNRLPPVLLRNAARLNLTVGQQTDLLEFGRAWPTNLQRGG